MRKTQRYFSYAPVIVVTFGLFLLFTYAVTNASYEMPAAVFAERTDISFDMENGQLSIEVSAKLARKLDLERSRMSADQLVVFSEKVIAHIDQDDKKTLSAIQVASKYDQDGQFELTIKA